MSRSSLEGRPQVEPHRNRLSIDLSRKATEISKESKGNGELKGRMNPPSVPPTTFQK
jgi:hypothetical protein